MAPVGRGSLGSRLRRIAPSVERIGGGKHVTLRGLQAELAEPGRGRLPDGVELRAPRLSFKSHSAKRAAST
jgi:hypothetical protein